MNSWLTAGKDAVPTACAGSHSPLSSHRTIHRVVFDSHVLGRVISKIHDALRQSHRLTAGNFIDQVLGLGLEHMTSHPSLTSLAQPVKEAPCRCKVSLEPRLGSERISRVGAPVLFVFPSTPSLPRILAVHCPPRLSTTPLQDLTVSPPIVVAPTTTGPR